MYSSGWHVQASITVSSPIKQNSMLAAIKADLRAKIGENLGQSDLESTKPPEFADLTEFEADLRQARSEEVECKQLLNQHAELNEAEEQLMLGNEIAINGAADITSAEPDESGTLGHTESWDD
ncbi:hypothetical protein BDZ91DRAFT_760281 [Kalaharituber pfeilii]|nr:hypothetical protein BDZ91DRAFT_760281 [Kalaharituber pfeilii]